MPRVVRHRAHFHLGHPFHCYGRVIDIVFPGPLVNMKPERRVHHLKYVKASLARHYDVLPDRLRWKKMPNGHYAFYEVLGA